LDAGRGKTNRIGPGIVFGRSQPTESRGDPIVPRRLTAREVWGHPLASSYLLRGMGYRCPMHAPADDRGGMGLARHGLWWPRAICSPGAVTASRRNRWAAIELSWNVRPTGQWTAHTAPTAPWSPPCWMATRPPFAVFWNLLSARVPLCPAQARQRLGGLQGSGASDPGQCHARARRVPGPRPRSSAGCARSVGARSPTTCGPTSGTGATSCWSTTCRACV